MKGFLFDLDGLLVDSEPLHFEAVVSTLKKAGYRLDWDFKLYCQKAHTQSMGLKKAFLELYPEATGRWNELYHEMKCCFAALVQDRPLPLVKGADLFLDLLQQHQKKIAVVTNSSTPMVRAICDRQKVLDKVPLWITREDYLNAKPKPDGYLKALEVLKLASEETVGFEDSVRGIEALKQAQVLPVHIHKEPFGEAIHYLDFTHLLQDKSFLDRILHVEL